MAAAKSTDITGDNLDVMAESCLERARRAVTVEPAILLWQMGSAFLLLADEQFVYSRMKEKASNDFTDISPLNDSMVVVEECGQEEMESPIQAQVISYTFPRKIAKMALVWKVIKYFIYCVSDQIPLKIPLDVKE